LANQKQELLVVAMSVFRSDPLTNMAPQAILVSDWSISKKYSSLKPLGQINRKKIFFRNQQIRNKNWLWRPYLTTDRNEMSNLVLYKVSSKQNEM
jgi:hypothetical protein